MTEKENNQQGKSGETGTQNTNTGGHGASADTHSGTLSGQRGNTNRTGEQTGIKEEK
ncbi:hypothetical protein [Deinococcus cellulosilyticus]|uniref:Uncharacterized protein n=1 Tax=Deinococcus cellulosilyticus (strain DSM 18568 / NBRC 106333 / KACC 11606 / 5516J-15) TaxID=1223518 RepID=A0A511N2M5_DEIC1|nr:hypothetical protein [Deinococcus cellulosilyticus]GEM46718.1 hypothetical protein DC3_23530 [Deinococcus cellulosilyticus NBRC 106333 = KACC 11606]